MSATQIIKVNNTAGFFTYEVVQGTSHIENAKAVFAVWNLRATSRKALRKLDSRMLDDIGVIYAVAQAEAKKHFWVK